MPIRVLHLITWLNPGGIERWLISMLRAVDREQVLMDFCCKGPNIGNLAGQAKALGAAVYHCPLDLTHLGFLRRFAKIVHSGKYSILHNHLQLYSGVGVFAAKRCNIPVITNFHNTSFPPQAIPNLPFIHKLRDIYGNISMGYAVRHSDIIMGDAQATLDYIDGRFQIPPGHEMLLHYGVQLTTPEEESQKQNFRAELGLDGEQLMITHVGRFLAQKNHEGLVRIAEKVIARDRRAHFVLVGDGHLRGMIEDMVRTRNLMKHFTFLGIRSDVEKILSCSDIFFFPSLWEGIPVAVLEAMAAYLPVVGSDPPEMRETVLDGETGLLWPVHDEEGMAEQVLDLMADPGKRQDMGAAGRRVVEAEFSLEAGAERLCKVYESLSHP